MSKSTISTFQLFEMFPTYEQNRDVMLAKSRERSSRPDVVAKRKARTKEKRSETIQKMYNLSPERYQAMLAEQKNRCLSCGRPFVSTKKEFSPCVDHDHDCCPGKTSCGKCLRGLICFPCNRNIGIIEANPFLLDYIHRFKERGRPCPKACVR